jgi:hypothetical protein
MHTPIIMGGPGSLSIKESIKLWFGFAKKSYINFIIVLSLIVVYSTVAAITLPVYAVYLLFYLYKLKVTDDNYAIIVETGDSRSQLIWLIHYILWAEPNIRAFDTARILRSLRSKRPSGHLKRLMWLRFQAFVFVRLTSIPYVYIKHINFWVLSLDREHFPNREERDWLLRVYTSYEF